MKQQKKMRFLGVMTLLLPATFAAAWFALGRHTPGGLNQSLAAAIADDNPREVHDLLRAGANPNAPVYAQDRRSIWQRLADAFNHTPFTPQRTHSSMLLYAAFRDGRTRTQDSFTDNVEVIRELIEAGADVNVHPTDPDMSPVIAAASFGKLNTLRVLLEHGASPDAVDGPSSRWTPLLIAASCGRVDMVALLVEYGADPNKADIRGISPLARTLEMAGLCDHDSDNLKLLAVGRYLMAHGANAGGVTDDGRTLDQVARDNVSRRNDPRVMWLLAEFRNVGQKPLRGRGGVNQRP